MTTGVELRFDAVPSGYVPSSSRNVTLGGGPPANLPEGTIGAWGIQPPLLSRDARVVRTILPDPHASADLDFSTVDPGYVPPASNAVLLQWGELPPVGGQTVFPGGFSDSMVPPPAIRTQYRFVLPVGSSHQVFGAAKAWKYSTFVSAYGFNSNVIGSHNAQNKHRTVQPTGFVAYQSGQANIINRNRYVAAGNIAPPPWGANPTVWLYTRYLKPGGLLATAIPDVHRISHERQFVQLNAGVPAPGMGTAWVSQGTRVLEPIGTFLDAVARPMVGGTRFLEPPGWDSSAFGTRIIPESQTVAPQGFAELWGQQAINNWLTFAEPAGFQSTVQEEYRWGRADVWNLRQYVVQEYDPDSELNPPPWSQWTLVENRN
ncbi:TPA: hypothetical protein ONB35_006615, partial [Pseudomonas aeruginosa]|nr:hypothetical protein [Pseudomonas aeruginosa]